MQVVLKFMGIEPTVLLITFTRCGNGRLIQQTKNSGEGCYWEANHTISNNFSEILIPFF
jgi:hypothetical protein